MYYTTKKICGNYLEVKEKCNKNVNWAKKHHLAGPWTLPLMDTNALCLHIILLLCKVENDQVLHLGCI